MSALTEDRLTSFRTGDLYSFPIAASVTCYAGGLAVIMPDGKVRPGIVDASAPSCVAIGRFRTRATAVDNVTVEIEPGIFRWTNHSTDPVTVASLQSVCYVADDQTVAATSANLTRSVAGIVVDVTSEGVWVSTFPASANATTSAAAKVDTIDLGTVAMAGTGVLRHVALRSGTISSFGTVTSAAITTGDATLTLAINGTGVTGGVQTIPLAGSAADVAQVTTPTALNTFEAGDVISFTVGGTAGGSAVASVSFATISE